jgi:hypothetical protein
MDAYARTGSHLEAIKAAGAGRYFSEDMFVRFRPLAAFGTWRGKTLNLAACFSGRPREPSTRLFPIAMSGKSAAQKPANSHRRRRRGRTRSSHQSGIKRLFGTNT